MVPPLFALSAIRQGFSRATFDVTPEQVDQLRMGLWYAQIGSANNPEGEIRGQIRSLTRASDGDGGDGAVCVPQERSWYDPRVD